jgi:Flp pilus assembly protein TadD
VNPFANPAWMNWGILEGQAGNWTESERLLRRAVELRPKEAKGWYNLAVCLEQQGRRKEADAARASVP